MKSTRRAAAAAATLVSALALAGCGGDSDAAPELAGTWTEIVEAANEEGEVLLYSTQHPDNLAALEAAFEDEYPDIDMEFVRGTDVEINPRVETELQTGQGTADVHMSSDALWVLDAAESGDYSVSPVGPAFDEADYDRDASILQDRLFLTSGAVFGLGWNTDAVPEGLESPEDLLDERFEGKIGVIDPAGFRATVDQYTFFQENWADGSFNDDLAELGPRVYPGSLPISQALSSGEIWATPMIYPLVREVEGGAPVDWLLPDPAWGTPWYSHVLQSSPHPNAAQVLADFMVTEAGQTALSYGYASVLPDIEDAVFRAQEIEMPDVRSLTQERVDAFQADWESSFRG